MKISRQTLIHIVFDDDGNTFQRKETTFSDGNQWGNYLRWSWLLSANKPNMSGIHVGKTRARKLEAEFKQTRQED